MLAKLLISFGLMSVCVIIHASGVMAALRHYSGSPVLKDPRLWRQTSLLIRLAAWLIVLHLIEIAAWGTIYQINHVMPDPHAAFYFSAVTYTTTGYGDLVLPQDWRLVGGIEALTGILMCGWSTGFFFAILARIHYAQKLGQHEV
jgi:hypothetical protein